MTVTELPDIDDFVELTPAQMDYWVHQAMAPGSNAPAPPYSTDPEHGEPVIGKYGIKIRPDTVKGQGAWSAGAMSFDQVKWFYHTKPTRLTAAMSVLAYAAIDAKRVAENPNLREQEAERSFQQLRALGAAFEKAETPMVGVEAADSADGEACAQQLDWGK